VVQRETNIRTIKNVAKFFATLVFAALLGNSEIFAQPQHRLPPPSQRPAQQTETTTPSNQTDDVALPFRNDASGRHLRAILDTVEFILRPTERASRAFNPRSQPTIEERRGNWQQAFDTIETIEKLIHSDDLAKAYYFYGKGIIYRDKAWSRLFGRDSSVIFARQAIDNFELLIQTGLGSSSTIYQSLAMLCFDFLNNPRTALIYLDRALTLNPNQIYTYVAKAQILRSIGRTEEACQTLRQAREIESLIVIEMMMSSYGCP